MALAQIGPLTTMLEAAATAVGAGAVLGSVYSGLRGLLRRRTSREIERGALFGGYLGGGIGAVLTIVDVIVRYVIRNELSEESIDVTERDLRNANIGILVAALIAAGGVVIFRNSGEAALELVGLTALVGAFAVYTILDELAERKKKKSRQ